MFSYRGEHLGTFEDGLFWDRRGAAVAFVAGAEGALLLPIPEAAPAPVGPPPARPEREKPSAPPVKSVPWIRTSWGAFVARDDRSSGPEDRRRDER